MKRCVAIIGTMLTLLASTISAFAQSDAPSTAGFPDESAPEPAPPAEPTPPPEEPEPGTPTPAPAPETPAPAEPAQTAEQRPATEAECFPQCREGYVCRQGECVSLCNPPCASGETCIQGKRCEVAGPLDDDIEEPPLPKHRSFAERKHSAIGLHVGLGGRMRLEGANAGTNTLHSDLKTTWGLNMRSDIPLGPYVLIGPLFQLGLWEAKLPQNPGPSYYTDLSLFVRARVPIEGDKVNWQIWGGVPVGLTLSVLNEDVDPTLESFGFGWNIGALLGAAVHFSPKWGLYSEAGWLQHKMNHDRRIGPDGNFKLAQTVLNVGVLYRD